MIYNEILDRRGRHKPGPGPNPCSELALGETEVCSLGGSVTINNTQCLQILSDLHGLLVTSTI
jgi:hypothetical protein